MNYFHYHIFGLHALTINQIQSTKNRKTKTNSNPNPDPNWYMRCCPDSNARIQKKEAESEEEVQIKN